MHGLPIQKSFRFRLYFFLLIIFILAPGSATAVELTVGDPEIGQENSFSVPVVAHDVEKLAGINLSISYNDSLLTYEKFSRSQATRAMLYVVNDKTPGKLIIVMAGAKGITGKDLTLFSLQFSQKDQTIDGREQKISISQAELMNENLKNITCELPQNTIQLVK